MVAHASRLVILIALAAFVLLNQSVAPFLVGPGANARGDAAVPRALAVETSKLPSAPSATETNALPFSVFVPLNYKRFPTETVFGVGLSRLNASSGFTQMAQAGISFARVDTVVSWASVEPVDGTRNWGALAELEQGWLDASLRGVQPIVVIRVAPTWAQQIPPFACGPIKPDKLSSFASFLNELVTRYSAPPYNVKYWEIWNEPDIDYRLTSADNEWGCWGNQDDAYYGGGYYATMLKAVYPQIKAADPNAQVLTGGLLLDCDPRPGGGCAALGKTNRPPLFFEGILRNGGGSYFDGISFHAYDYYYYDGVGRFSNANWQSAWNTTGPTSIAKTEYIKSLLSTYGVSGKFLMNTESALLTCYTCSPDETLETTKAYYVAQAYAIAIADGLRANLWYGTLVWRNSNLLNDDLSPRPAYTAFRVSNRELNDSSFEGALSPSDVGGSTSVKGYKFNRQGRSVWVVWSLDGNPHSITPSPGTPTAVLDALGNTVTPSSTISVDLKPLYLEWAP